MSMDQTSFEDLARSLAWQLGQLRKETWTVAVDPGASTYAILSCGIARLSLNWLSADARLSVAGLAPDGHRFGKWHITVDPQRGLLTVGKDIDRRIIGAGYLDDLLVARAKQDARDAAEAERYTRRELRDITMAALSEFAAIPDSQSEARRRARAALDQMRGQDLGLGHPDLREPYVARFRVQPGLHLTVDASHNIMLEVRTVDEAELLAAYALGDVVKLADTAANCRSVVRIAEEDGPEVARVVARDWGR